MSKHTPEPWYFDYDCTGSKVSDHLNGGWFTAKCLGPDRIENSRRIVACVNACAGMETEHLENQAMLGETLVKRFNLLKSEAAELTKQRDDLMAALDLNDAQIMEFISIAFRHAEIRGDFELSDVRDAMNMVKSKAITKTKGGAE